MNIKEAKNEIKNTVQAYLKKDEMGDYKIPPVRQRPILLMGPPGIGKTQIMEQIARECKVALVAYNITHHTRQSAVGLPFIRETSYDGKTYSVTEYTMSEIIASVYRRMEETGLREGILFVDEINCVSETLAPTMLQFLQGKMFGNQKVPAGWVIVAAGNPPEYNKSVRDFDMVTLDRVRRIDVEADYGVWKEYAREQRIHGALLSYLELRPKNFYRVEADVDGLQFVTARGWEDLSQLVYAYEELGLPAGEEVVYEFLRHHDVAEDVAAYLELYHKYQDDYGIPEILKGCVRTEVYTRLFQAAFDERVSVVGLLTDALQSRLGQICRQKRKTDRWYDYLKEYQHTLKEEETHQTPAEQYKMLLEKLEAINQKAGRAELEENSALREKESLVREMAAFQPAAAEAKEAFGEAAAGFEQCRQQLELLEQEGKKAVEAAFDFMENAFGNGQEMILFVTELTLMTEAVQFFAQHPCERYLQYNQELLIGTRRRELLDELNQ